MEDTAQSFARIYRGMAVDGRYFRFNVTHSLDRSDDDELNAVKSIMSLAGEYFNEVATRKSIERCAEKLQRHNRFIHESLKSRDLQSSIISLSKCSPQGSYMGRASVGASKDMESRFFSSGWEEPDQVPSSGVPLGLNERNQALLKRTESELPEENMMMKELAQCILTDTEMEALVVTAYDKIGAIRLKKNLVILLEDFAQRLSVMELFGDLPNFIGSKAPAVIDQLFLALPKNSTPARTMALPPSYEEAISARDEVQDLGGMERKFHILSQLQVMAVYNGFDSSQVQQSKPFQQLCNDVRRFVFPSFNSYVHHQVGPHLRPAKLFPICSVEVCVYWELPDFLRTELDPADDISQMITLTGTLTRAQAITCGDYMRQTWPQSGPHTLEAVIYALKNETSYYQHGPTHSIQLESSDECLTVEINGRSPEIVETIEQFAWLASVFRFHVGESLGLSEAELQICSGRPENDSVLAELRLRSIQNIPESDLLLGSCWVPLFDRSVLAWGFPTADRGEFYGLELPFELLLKMFQARLPVEFQDSIVIRQESLTAFPVANSPVGTQWHATAGGIDGFFEEINAFPLLPVQDNLTAFLEGRHFLGWVSQAQIKLGTEEPSDQSSCAPVENHRGLQLGEQIPVSINIRPPWVGFSVGANFHLPRAQMQRIENRQMAFDQLLGRSANSPALYYDLGTKTGWIVPELSLLFHIVCAHLFRYWADSDALYKIYYAERSSNGGSAALAAIRSCSSIVLGENHSEEGVKRNYCLRDIVRFYLDYFENRKEAIRLRLEQNELCPDLGIRGWDFADIRDCTSLFRSRLIRPPCVSGRPDWWSLTKSPNLMVVFGCNLGQVIVPDGAEQRPCSSWVEIPRERNVLVFLNRCVEDMGRPWQGKLPRMYLSKKLCWHQPEDSRPFGDCLGHDCNPIQKFRRMTLRDPCHGLRNPDGIPPNGAVIFGLPTEGKKHVMSQQIRPCRPVELLIQPSGQRRYLRTRGIRRPWKWIYQLLAMVTNLERYESVIVLLGVVMLIGCAWIVVITWRP
ncbi:hypothetical protein FE257_006697 [Aspergillus nanangensis]|uniref:Uncharacterized protein n=1 Tax=Aspergillus nanangensis TaxID=2582783 RepID=A0AAD4CPC2_ASPNN|nr:hypothetical protein FE257_006697 [Aspergillus nanangensis]